MTFILYVTLISLTALSGTNRDSAFLLLQQGDFSMARLSAEKAHGEDMSDTAVTFLFAKTRREVAFALETYKALAGVRTVKDSLRSEAYYRLGCASYMRGRFQKAASYFKKACSLSADPAFLNASFLCAIHDTLDSAGLTSLSLQAADTGFPAQRAHFYLGALLFTKKDYAAALPHFNASVESSDTPPWSCQAYAGAYCCAAYLQRPQEASAALDHLRRAFPSYLERPMVAKAKTTLQSKSLKDSTSRDVSIALPFSLQVGAFSEIEHAEALKNDLSRRFPSVSVAAGTLAGKTVYRVRVGAFETKAAAQTFGDSALSKKGLQFRIIEE